MCQSVEPDPRRAGERDAWLDGRSSLASVATTTLISSISPGRPRPRLVLPGGDPACLITGPSSNLGRPRHPDRMGNLRVRHRVRGGQHHRAIGQPGTLGGCASSSAGPGRPDAGQEQEQGTCFIFTLN
jgi:hypothetical protein